ncbi:helix-turn-helix domain-containing protein [Bacteriovoracaceae bacterium]|nr:helix-turn-helix domain-containing protein [Bacteriovoracaceae bacterium]
MNTEMTREENNTAVHCNGHLTEQDGPRRPHGHGEITRKRYLSVKELSKEYQMSLRVIYSLIKREADFPFVNMGLKKKYMVDREAFETWLFKRTYKEQGEYLKIPDINELTGYRR